MKPFHWNYNGCNVYNSNDQYDGRDKGRAQGEVEMVPCLQQNHAEMYVEVCRLRKGATFPHP